jgi:hypothetical protein
LTDAPQFGQNRADSGNSAEHAEHPGRAVTNSPEERRMISAAGNILALIVTAQIFFFTFNDQWNGWIPQRIGKRDAGDTFRPFRVYHPPFDQCFTGLFLCIKINKKQNQKAILGSGSLG